MNSKFTKISTILSLFSSFFVISSFFCNFEFFSVNQVTASQQQPKFQDIFAGFFSSPDKKTSQGCLVLFRLKILSLTTLFSDHVLLRLVKYYDNSSGVTAISGKYQDVGCATFSGSNECHLMCYLRICCASPLFIAGVYQNGPDMLDFDLRHFLFTLVQQCYETT